MGSVLEKKINCLKKFKSQGVDNTYKFLLLYSIQNVFT